jgi:hypothetical protein
LPFKCDLQRYSAGAYGALNAAANPSFVLMDIDGPRVVAYVVGLCTLESS